MRAHYLRANKTVQLPRCFIFVDTETEEYPLEAPYIGHVLRVGAACYVEVRDNRERDTEVWITFRQPEQFWDWVTRRCRPKQRVLMYAHNMHFDFFVLRGFEMLRQYGWTITSWYFDSRIFIIKARKGRRRLIVLDSGNIIKYPLEKIGKIVGLEKLKVDFKRVSDKRLVEYCMRDVEILKRWVLTWRRYVAQHRLGSFALTLPSQALNAYRHRFMSHKILIHHNRAYTELEQQSYRGGRCECFYIGEVPESPIYYLDVNSLYPYVMYWQWLPTYPATVMERCSVKTLERLLKNWCVIADVLIHVEKPCIAYRGERLIFPVGTFRVVLCSPELEYLFRYEKVLHVNKVALYRGAPIFRDYVGYFYAQKRLYKEEKNWAWYEISKLMLNSLYGKFAQKQYRFEPVGDSPSTIPYIEDYTILPEGRDVYRVHLDGRIWERREEGLGFNSFVAISSFAAAYARMELWYFMKEAGLQNVYYVDTDSLFVNQEGYERLKGYINPDRLGALDLVAKADRVVLYGCKDYQFGDITKCKGVRAEAERIGLNTFEQIRFLKARSMLRLGWRLGAVSQKVIKRLRRDYRKGVVGEDGYVSPFKLP